MTTKICVDPGPSGPRAGTAEAWVSPDADVSEGDLHLDLRITAGTPADLHGAVVQAEVERVVAAGARVLWSVDDHHVTLADPEGNEFCVA